MPKVSVIVPSYNHGPYITETIESVLSQDFEDFELVIVDDGSKDDTVEKILKFKDPRLKFFGFKENRGACTAANKCILESSGEYIAMLSSDDVFLPGKLAKQTEFLDKNPGIGAVFGKASFVGESGAPVETRNPFKYENRGRHEWLRHFFYRGNCLCHPSAMIRRDCYNRVGFYDERFASLPDLDFWVRLCMHYEIYILDEPLINFRIRDNGANASGASLKGFLRLPVEYIQVCRHYLAIKDTDDFLKIFPEATKFGVVEKGLIPYFIARLAIEANNYCQNYFALNTLYDFLSTASEETKRKCGFEYKDLISLAGKLDCFNLVESGRIKKQFKKYGNPKHKNVSTVISNYFKKILTGNRFPES